MSDATDNKTPWNPVPRMKDDLPKLIAEVVVWLREQGAINYEAALDVLIAEDAHMATGLTMTGVRRAVDAALDTEPPKESE